MYYIYSVCIEHPYFCLTGVSFLISYCHLCNCDVLHDQQPLPHHCLQVPSHVEQRLQELERGIRSEHKAMGQERRIDQQARVSDKLQEVTLPFTNSVPHVPIGSLVLSH